MFKNNNKGQAAYSTGSLITLIVGVGIAILVLIFVGVMAGNTFQLSEDKINEIGLKTVSADQTNNVLFGTTNSFDHTLIVSGTLSFKNYTGGSIGIGNFTVNYGAGTFVFNNNTYTNPTFYNKSINASYQYYDTEVHDKVMGAAVGSFDALEQTSSYMPLVVLAAIIGLVLTIVLGFTQFGSGGSSGGRGMSAL